MSEDPSGRTKVGCSIKLADQKQGTDLDPNNMKWQPRGEGGGPGGGGSGRAPIQASVNVEPGASGRPMYAFTKAYSFIITGNVPDAYKATPLMWADGLPAGKVVTEKALPSALANCTRAKTSAMWLWAQSLCHKSCLLKAGPARGDVLLRSAHSTHNEGRGMCRRHHRLGLPEGGRPPVRRAGAAVRHDRRRGARPGPPASGPGCRCCAAEWGSQRG